MEDWIENELIEDALKSKSLINLEKSGLKFCISTDFNYCILARRHHAWETEKGWREANEAPTDKKLSRWVLNFYKKDSSWFKIFAPLKYNIKKIEADGEKFKIITETETIIGNFASHDALMWEVLTGNAEKEAEIEKKFMLISST